MTKQTHDDNTTDLETVLANYEKEQAQKDIFRPRSPGEFRVRILPPRERGLYYVAFGMHFGLQYVSSKFGDARAVACLQKTLGQDCPMCELHGKWRYEAYGPGGRVNPHKEQLAKEIRANDRFVLNMVDLDNPQAGVQTWEMARTAHDFIRSLFKEWGDITRPGTATEPEGKVLKVTFTKKGEFLTPTAVTISARTDAIPVQDWREQRKDLEAYARRRVMSREKLLEIVANLIQGQEVPRPIRSEVPHNDEPEVVEGDDDIPAEFGPSQAASAFSAGGVSREQNEKLDEALNDPTVQALLAKIRDKKHA